MTSTYFQSIKDPQLGIDESVLDYLLKLDPIFECSHEARESFSLYLQSLNKLIRRTLPPSILSFAKSILDFESTHLIQSFYNKIQNELPCISWTESEENFPYIISISTLCSAENTHGVGRFLSDVFSRWLVPGKQLQLVFVHNVAFRFSAMPDKTYFIHELFAKIENKKDLLLIQSHLPSLVREIKLNILAVQHARKIISMTTLTIEQKRLIIQENIATLLDKSMQDADLNMFDHLHHFLAKANAEEKVSQIKEELSPLIEFRPQLFERDIFTELQKFVFLFRDAFAANRSLKHLTRIIAYTYLFRKMITNNVLTKPNQRHLMIKLLHTSVKVDGDNQKTLGILIGINLLRENEIIDEKHLLRAIQSLVPTVKRIPESTITDRRANNHVRTIYLEVYKPNSRFTKEDVTKLQKQLSREIKTRIESVINPIFMPRNEEEVMRNILILSHQLKYTGDIPQVIISFHKQTEENLSFTIILLRVLRPEDKPLQSLFGKFKTDVTFTDHEIKIIGRLRKKYPKEANIFEMHLEKKQFLRRDYSVDLNLARRFIYTTLSEMLGEVRDYNGGMISKQIEVLNDLKKILLQINIRNDFLLENFFYSLTPTYMQSILKTNVLKKQFLLVLEALEHDYSTHLYFLKTQIVENHFLITISAINPTLKEFLEQKIDQLEFEPSTLCFSYVNIYDISCLSYILKFTDSDEHQKFLQLIIESVKIWKGTMEKSIPATSFPVLTLG